MPALLIRDPGPATTVQDVGRLAARRAGVPVAGTVAPDWLALANALIGAPEGAAGLEIRLAGPRFEVDGPCLVAAGGPVELRIEGQRGSRTVPPFTATALDPGDRVTTGPVRAGTLAVLAFSGGIDVPPVLGSRATYTRARLGGLEGRALVLGDRVPIGDAPFGPPLALPSAPKVGTGPIHVLPGPQDDHFTAEALATFLSEAFTVTTEVDRMGMRLSGPTLDHRARDLSQIVSDGIVPGAVQVPGNGAPIVLLADGQTVGGYPKIATVISADLPRLARMAPGQTVRFEATDISRAEAARAEEARRIAALVASARPAGTAGGLDLRRLYEDNLVSGVIGGPES
ncbi:MAG: biotin-dependent carboxyltransferase family protein [Pseudomonadota bacterium]